MYKYQNYKIIKIIKIVKIRFFFTFKKKNKKFCARYIRKNIIYSIIIMKLININKTQVS